MTERPILFSGAMVRALQAGTKTQTRRAMKAQPPHDCSELFAGWYHPTVVDRHGVQQPGKQAYGAWTTDGEWGLRSPYGEPGDLLWVREAWKAHTTFDHLPPRDIPQSHVWYMADDGYKAESRFRHGMFMPRWASRLTLGLMSLRAERLQDISEADALAEGIVRQRDGGYGLADTTHYHATDPRICYWSLWDHLNGAGSVESNPFVWVLGFPSTTTQA